MNSLGIVGAGALGLMLAARCELAGIPTTLAVRRKEQADRLCKQGVLLTDGKTGNEYKVNPTVKLLEETDSLPDCILLTVKQTSVDRELAVRLARILTPDSRVLCFQNGIGHIPILASEIGKERLWIAVTTEAALKRSDCEVVHTGQGSTWFGPAATEPEERFAETVDTAKQKSVQNLLANAGFSIFMSNNINNRVWHKLLVNAVINPLTALWGVTNGELLESGEAEPLMNALFREGAELAERTGIELDPDLWSQLLDVCRLTASNRSSMLQDILAGRPTEIEAINGGLLRIAAEVGMDMPTHLTVYRLVKGLQGRSRGYSTE